jgi:importin subunit alpha-6/7
LADGPWYQIEALISAGICQQLVEILNTGCSSKIVGVLLVCINISSGTSGQTQVLLDCGIIPLLSKLLDISQNNQVLKNAAFLISNIAADSKYKIQSLIDEQIFEKLAKIFEDCENSTQLEILNAVNNCSHNGEDEQILHLESSGCGLVLLKQIESLILDSEAVKIALDAIWNITLAQARARAVTSITKCKQCMHIRLTLSRLSTFTLCS